jgi:hypothetical protein
MAFKIRPTSIEELKKYKFKNEDALSSFWTYMNDTYKDTASFAIDDKDSTKIKILPSYENKKSKLAIETKKHKLKLAFGKGSDKFKISGSGDDKTTLQEVGFLLVLDMLLNKQKTLADYKPSKRMHVKANLENVINFLETDTAWFKSVLGGAEKTIIQFGASKLRQFNFHHDDQLFNIIRKTGKDLSGLSHMDKWNPADVFLIKKWNPDTSNIIRFNDYIFNSGDVIGISLKKGEKEALHGALALNVVSEEFGYGKLSAKFKENNDAFKKEMSNLIKKIKSHPLKNKIYVHSDSNNISESLNNLNIESVNFFKSVPPAIEWIAKSNEDLEEMLYFAVMTAMSISPKSCSHWKLEGSKLTVMPVPSKIDLIRSRIKLNGNTDTIFDIKFNSKQIKLQLRSKGSLPQFIIIKTAENPNDLYKITQMK